METFMNGKEHVRVPRNLLVATSRRIASLHDKLPVQSSGDIQASPLALTPGLHRHSHTVAPYLDSVIPLYKLPFNARL